MMDFLDVSTVPCANPGLAEFRQACAGRMIRPRSGKVPKASLLALPVLVILAGRAAGDATVRALPSKPFPAQAAASLIYALVPNPSGAATWAEREVEAIRMGEGRRAREDLESPAARLLLSVSVHAPSDATYVPPRLEALASAPAPAVPEFRIVGAFEAIGLTPEDLVEKQEVSEAAVSAVDAVLGAIDWGLDGATRLRAMLRESSVPSRIDDQPRHPKPEYIRFVPPPPSSHLPFVFAKRVVRSIYKILLGAAIGILIWGTVRRSEGGSGAPGAFFR
jgi:hypothetical protein